MRFVLILFVCHPCFAQEMTRSTFSAVGTSTKTTSDYYVSQSVGQQSTIGFFEMMVGAVIQGYQQPTGYKIYDTSIETERLTLFPLPFTNELNILFSLAMEGTCTAEVFDHLGRLVVAQEIDIDDHQAKLSLFNLASASYVLKITTNTNVFYETIIKAD